MEPEFQGQIEKIEKALKVLVGLPQPNQPLAEFEIFDNSFLEGWRARLVALSQDNLIEEITNLLQEVPLPALNAAETHHEHLKIYFQVSELREIARATLSNAIELGYPHDLGMVARTNEILPDLANIATSLERMEKRIGKIEEQTASSVGDAISISVGPIGVTLSDLKRAGNFALKKIRLDAENTNISALLVALSKTASLANKISKQVGKLVTELPARFRVALSEVVRLANQAADQGVELLRSIKSRRSTAAPAAGQQGVSAKPDIDVAAVLKAKRVAKKLSVAQVSGALKLRMDHVMAIEAGNFGNLPGRTYTVGWVRAYAKLLGLNSSDLSEALNAKLPPKWKQGGPG